MKIKYVITVFFVSFLFIFSSCFSQRRNVIIPLPFDTQFPDYSIPIVTENITETRAGLGVRNLPIWFQAFISGGIEEVEQLNQFNDKYVFLARSEGQNFIAMQKWAENFSPVRDTAMVAGRRIEKKMVTSSLLYPDYEYGVFFENVVKNAYSTSYPGTVKEDTFWIKMNVEGMPNTVYVFFVLLSIEKQLLQDKIKGIFADSYEFTALTRDQRNAVNRLQQNFFEGF